MAASDDPDYGAPGYANNILSGFVTPIVAPGGTVGFTFNATYPYNERNQSMSDINLTVGVYMYATQETTAQVDGLFPNPPLLNGTATELTIPKARLIPGEDWKISLPIETSKKTPHGSYFSQSTYFVRFNMTYTIGPNDTQVVLKSRGCFSPEEWDRIVSFAGNESIVNRTYLKSLGVDGLLPDSSFGIKIPLPKWPLAAIIAGAVGASSMATYYYVLDNPGKHPRLEKRFYQLRGKLSEFRGKPKDRG